MKNILIINGHPNKHSLCAALAERYYEGALKSNANCTLINLNSLNFNPNLEFGYQKRMDLEPDLLATWEKIQQADHLVWIYPNWWGTYPALVKGFIDRLFLPGMAFGRKENSVFTTKLLKGKTARVIVTMDSPNFYYRFFVMQSGHNSMKLSILKFCGISPVKFTNINMVKTSTTEKRSKWLDKIYKMGVQLK